MGCLTASARLVCTVGRDSVAPLTLGGEVVCAGGVLTADVRALGHEIE